MQDGGEPDAENPPATATSPVPRNKTKKPKKRNKVRFLSKKRSLLPSVESIEEQKSLGLELL
jgi:hypothetical protein